MSARERFFKKIQQKQPVPPTPGSGSVHADIQTFCLRMEELVLQVSEWFEGSGVEVIASTTYLQDLSTIGSSLNSGAASYQITTLRLQNDSRSVSIAPEQLYQNGSKGCVTLTVETPDRVPGKARFYLCMAPESGWFIRSEHQTAAGKSLMTEDVFFRAIDNLA